jgi:hypothetical protein
MVVLYCPRLLVYTSALINEKGNLLYPVIKITFVCKDLPLAPKLIEVLGRGEIMV